MNTIMRNYVKTYKFSSSHKEQLLQDEKCGCFYCLSVFDPQEIIRWTGDNVGTAICPYCGIDSVIGESSGYPLTKESLEKMHSHWF